MTQLKFTKEEAYQMFLEWRNLGAEDVCPACNGSGKRAYASATVWQSGIGEQIITVDVCNKCWGSGSESKPWAFWARRTCPGGQ